MQAVVQEILGPKPYRLYVKAIGKGAHHDPVISGGDTLQRKIPFPRRSASPLLGRIRTPEAAYTRSNSFSFRNRNESFSSWNSPDTIGVTFFWTGVRILRNRNSKSIRRSWDTRSDTGKALRWLWIPLASMKEPGSIRKATRIPASCTSSKSWLARASIICTSKPRSKTLGPTHGPGPLLSIWPGVRIGRSRNTFANRTTAIRITTSRQQRGATGTGNAGAEFGHGHPAKGTFLGEWGPNAAIQDRLMLLMDWDGRAITGTINPGPQAVPITKAELNPDNWTLHIEGGAGAARVVFDGKFENLTWLARSLTGTYTQGNQRGTFKITRQY